MDPLTLQKVQASQYANGYIELCALEAEVAGFAKHIANFQGSRDNSEDKERLDFFKNFECRPLLPIYISQHQHES